MSQTPQKPLGALSSLSNLPAYSEAETNSQSQSVSSPSSNEFKSSSSVPSFLTQEDAIVYRSAIVSNANDNISSQTLDLSNPLAMGGPSNKNDISHQTLKDNGNDIVKGISSLSLTVGTDVEVPTASSYSVSPQPPHVEISSSFYTNEEVHSVMKLANDFLSIKPLPSASYHLAFDKYDGEAKLHGIVYPLSGVNKAFSSESPVVFTLKVFESDESQRSNGKFLIEVQRRSGSLPLFSQFYFDFFSFNDIKIKMKLYNGEKKPKVISTMSPPELKDLNIQNIINSKGNDSANLMVETVSSMLKGTQKVETVVSSCQLIQSVLANAPYTSSSLSSPSSASSLSFTSNHISSLLSSLDSVFSRPFVSKLPLLHVLHVIRTATTSDEWVLEMVNGKEKYVVLINKIISLLSFKSSPPSSSNFLSTAEQNEESLLTECQEHSFRIILHVCEKRVKELSTLLSSIPAGKDRLLSGLKSLGSGHKDAEVRAKANALAAKFQ